jgi:hypothetical protein
VREGEACPDVSLTQMEAEYDYTGSKENDADGNSDEQ